jgi:hypothetical protein
MRHGRLCKSSLLLTLSFGTGIVLAADLMQPPNFAAQQSEAAQIPGTLAQQWESVRLMQAQIAALQAQADALRTQTSTGNTHSSNSNSGTQDGDVLHVDEGMIDAVTAEKMDELDVRAKQWQSSDEGKQTDCVWITSEISRIRSHVRKLDRYSQISDMAVNQEITAYSTITKLQTHYRENCDLPAQSK